jgi:RNA polymerase sigma-70 factor (ECF subfamily)
MTEELLVKTLLDARPRLIAATLAVLRDVHQAEDLFQEVMIKALRMRESFSDEAGLLAWTRVSMRNQGIDFIRRAGRLDTILSELALNAVSERMEDSESHAARTKVTALRQCIAALPEESKRLLRLRYDEGRSGRDLAALLRRSEDAVYKALSRLHAALRKCAEERIQLLREAGA